MAPRKSKAARTAADLRRLADELDRMVGRRGKWEAAERVLVDVVIRDARPPAYGHRLVLVEPVSGSGTTWVRATSVKLVDE